MPLPGAESLGRTVLEIATESTKYFTDLKRAKEEGKSLGDTFDRVSDKFESFGNTVRTSGEQSASSAQLIGRAFERTDKDLQGLVSATKELAGADVVAKAHNYAQVIETLGGVSKLTAVEQAKVASVVGQAVQKYEALGVAAPRELQEILTATQRMLGPTSQLDSHLQQIQQHVATFSGDKVIQEATQIARAVEEIGGAEKLTAAETARVNAVLTEAINKYEVLGREAPAHLKKVQAETQQTVTLGQKIGDVFKSGFAQMTAAFSVATLIDRATTSLVAFVGKAIEGAGVVVDLSNKTGLSIKKIQELQYVSTQSGTSVDSLSDSVFKLSTTLAEGKKSARQAVQDLGLDLQTLRRQKPEQTFDDILAALERMPPSFERNLAMQRLFGKGAKEVAKLVADGYTQMKDSAQTSSDEQIKALDAAGDAWARFKRNVDVALTSILGGYALQREQVASLTGEETAQFQAVIRSGGDAAKVLAEIMRQRKLAAESRESMTFEDFGKLAGEQIAPLDRLRQRLKDLRDDFEALSPELKSAIAEGHRWKMSNQEIAETLEIGTEVVDNYVAALEKLEQQGKKDNAWLTSFRDKAKALETQLSLVFDAFKGKGAIPLSLLGQFKSEIDDVIMLAPIFGDRIGDATVDAAKALRQAQLDKAIKNINDEFTILFDKMRGKNADIQPLKQTVEQALVSIRQTIGAVEPEAVRLQARLVSLQKDSLNQRLTLINLEYDEQVASLEKEQVARRAAGTADEETYKTTLGVMAAERRKALDDATLDWEEHAITIRKVLLEAIIGLPGVITQQLDRGGWAAVGASIAEQIATGLTAHFLDLLKKNPAISPKELTRMQTAIGVGAAGGSAAGGLIGGSRGSQIAGLAGSVGGTALAATGAVTSSVALAAATAGIGAAAAAIYVGSRQILHNNAEWVKLGKGLGRDLGVAVSEGLLKQMEADAKKYGREAATLLHLSDIIDEAGGVETFGIDLAIRKTRDLFSMLERGDLTAKQVGDTFDTLFSTILPSAIDKTTGLVSRQFSELIRLAKETGIQSDAVDEFVIGQVQTAVTGIQSFLQVGADAYATLADLQKQYADASGSDRDRIAKDIEQQQKIIETTGITTQASATAFGAALAAIYAESTARGQTALEALAAIAPSINAFQAQLDATGLSGGAAFDNLRAMAALASDAIAGPALTAVSGLGQAMVALNNSGLLTQEIFAGLSGQVAQTYDSLIAQGKDGDQAIRLMQPTLQKIWELQQDFGYAVDDSTQAMLDQAEAQNTIGDKFRSVESRMLLALEHIADKFDELTGSSTRFTDSLGRIPKKVDVDVTVREKHSREDSSDGNGDYTQTPDVFATGAARGGRVTRRGIIPLHSLPRPQLPAYLDGGGFAGSIGRNTGRLIRFAPRGTDVVPAMLSPQELLLTATQQDNASRVIAAALRGMTVADRTMSAMNRVLAATGTDGGGAPAMAIGGRDLRVVFELDGRVVAERLVTYKEFADGFAKRSVANDTGLGTAVRTAARL